MGFTLNISPFSFGSGEVANNAAGRLLRQILAKFGEMGGLPPDLEQKLRRYGPRSPARPPTPEERDPGRAPRQPRRRR